MNFLDIRGCATINDKFRELTPETLFSRVNIFSSKSRKIARQNVNNETEPKEVPEGNQEWRRLVGSIRRKVQRHASGYSDKQSPSSSQTKDVALSRKNSLTHSLLKREKSCEKDVKRSETQQLVKQKSDGLETTSTTKTDLFKALSFRDKSTSASSKKVVCVTAPPSKSSEQFPKGVRKSDKKDSDRNLKPNISFSRGKCSGIKVKEGVKHDDFLKATMRIFLVVSPPAGKIQVIS